MDRFRQEIDHFSGLDHIWWGHKSVAGQKRYDRRYRLIRNKYKSFRNLNILEIGCGDGEFTRRLAKLPWSIVATDMTPEVIRRAKKGIKAKNVKFSVENAENLSFKDESFDIVCGISILHHINIDKSLKEAFRVLIKGGNIFFSEPNLLNPHTYAGLHIGFLRKKMEFSPGETALVRWEVARLLKRIGFKEISVGNFDFLHHSTPPRLIGVVEQIGDLLEKTPLIKEISGSLIIEAKKIHR